MVMFAVPPEAISAALIMALSSVAFTKVVVLSVPFHLKIDSPFTKFEPVAVKVKSGLPDVIVVGEMVFKTGFGFTFTTTSARLLFTGPNFQLKKGKKVPVPLFAVTDTVPFVIG